jgi:hypothetical protein
MLNLSGCDKFAQISAGGIVADHRTARRPQRGDGASAAGVRAGASGRFVPVSALPALRRGRHIRSRTKPTPATGEPPSAESSHTTVQIQFFSRDSRPAKSRYSCVKSSTRRPRMPPCSNVPHALGAGQGHTDSSSGHTARRRRRCRDPGGRRSSSSVRMARGLIPRLAGATLTSGGPPAARHVLHP